MLKFSKKSKSGFKAQDLNRRSPSKSSRFFTLTPMEQIGPNSIKNSVLLDIALKAQEKMQIISMLTQGHPEKWGILEHKWFTSLQNLVADTSSPVTMPYVELEEASLLLAQESFIDWLVSQISIAPSATNFQNGLCQHRRVLRSKNVYSYAEEEVVDLEFYNPQYIVTELQRFVGIKTYGNLPPIFLCLLRYAHFTAIHPFMDGNGRASRKILAVLLNENNIWRTFPLPVGFIIHRDRIRYIKYLRDALVESKWESYFSYMLKTLCAAAELSAITRFYHYTKYV